MYKVLLITPGQPALNPRLVKEADALIDAGYEVTVLFAYWNGWGYDFTQKLLVSKKWNVVCVGGDPVEKPLIYFISKLIYHTARIITKLCGPINYFAELAANRSSFFLLSETKKYKADLYIAHYIGALGPAVKAAKKHAAKCGFDAEDFHRQEVSDDVNSFDFKLAKNLEDKYLPAVDYITASSPQIAQAYQKLYKGKNPIVLFNAFPKNKHSKQRVINHYGPIKMVWFSQTLGKNRGLETIGTALKFLNSKFFELHLLGYIQTEIKQEFIDSELLGATNVFFHDPVQPDELVDFMSRFDIGLASEKKTPFNRDICLTNKLFTYLQSGLAIVASDTTAQKQFLAENPVVGEIYSPAEESSLANILSHYHLNRKLLFNTCRASLKLGIEQLNWENESRKFLNIVEQTIKH